jgi:hypothetical protein
MKLRVPGHSTPAPMVAGAASPSEQAVLRTRDAVLNCLNSYHTMRVELHVTLPNRVTLDGRQGTVTYDRATGTGQLLVDEIVLNYRLYGSFGQGYNFGVLVHGIERLTLSHSVRDGLPEIYEPDKPEQGLLLDEPIITNYAATYGSFSYASGSVQVTLGPKVPTVNALHLALLVALDVMYAKRVILFARDVSAHSTTPNAEN